MDTTDHPHPDDDDAAKEGEDLERSPDIELCM